MSANATAPMMIASAAERFSQRASPSSSSGDQSEHHSDGDREEEHRHRYASAWNPGQEEFTRLGKVLVYLMMASTNPALLESGSDRYEPLAFHVPALRR
ncbi:hypothetical protein [Streptomyces goshikiensis]|uniref:hypothetical protein n=1 Tax=Streptomyces goshikiensis TaxID=1942 RepID=UPI002ADF2705|nr:hypothetical protein [Streptomyces goshikiensis]